MEKSDTLMDQMAHFAGELTEAAVAGQAAGLRLLAAEMQALTQVMPGLAGPGHSPSEAEIEADFDNMPV